jgi:putative DNA-invertase from lambdoid prophage Rac
MVHRVALYARVSTGDQSCDRQVAELTAYAERCNFQVMAVAKETASGSKNDRAERTRWGRSTTDLLNTIQELADRQVTIRALNGADIDISTAQGKLMLNMLAAISEFEADLLRERIKSGIAHARSSGTKSGRAIGRPGFDRLGRVRSSLQRDRVCAPSLLKRASAKRL